ncbi:hypothetical protein GW17_00006342, partial [Ensete ventricosum]
IAFVWLFLVSQIRCWVRILAAMARSFLQAVSSSEEVAPPLRVVQMEGLVSVNFIGIFSDCGADRNIHELPGNGKILGSYSHNVSQMSHVKFDRWTRIFLFVRARVENMARKAAGEEPLPEEDPSNSIFKPIPEPSHLDSYLITNQTSNYCNQINGYASSSYNMSLVLLSTSV